MGVDGSQRCGLTAPARAGLGVAEAAAAAPRRGVCAEVRSADIDETPRQGEAADELVQRLAREKAESIATAAESTVGAVAGRSTTARPGPPPARTVVIGADTVISIDDEVFGKPSSDAEARTMLSRLSGRQHAVLTGVAVSSGGRTESAVSTTTVWFRSLDAADIDCYVACGEPAGKAGAYAIQGRGSLFVERIDGSFHGVVGLPIALVDQLCARLGWPLTTWAAAGR